MYKDLSHLGNDEIQVLMKRYYSGENIKKLTHEYNLNIAISKLYKYFPPIVENKYNCEYCHKYLVHNCVSKSCMDEALHKSELYCPQCGHRPFANRCNCDNCIDFRNNQIEEKKKQIYECYLNTREKIEFKELTFRNKVYLGCLCRALLKEDFSTIQPYIYSNKTIIPQNKFPENMYRELIHEGIIVVSPNSPIEAFVDDEKFPNTYYLAKVEYNLNLSFNTMNMQESIFEILNPQYYDESNSQEAYELWKEIATDECIEYLLHQIENVRFNFNPGEKTFTVMHILLESFSVSQIYGIIWKSVANASKLCLESNMNKNHAANSIIGGCERFAERALLENWDLTKYRRIKELPQSVLSEFFFNKVLKIGNLGFDLPPSNL